MKKETIKTLRAEMKRAKRSKISSWIDEVSRKIEALPLFQNE